MIDDQINITIEKDGILLPFYVLNPQNWFIMSKTYLWSVAPVESRMKIMTKGQKTDSRRSKVVTESILYSQVSSFGSISVPITKLPPNTMEPPNFVRIICFHFLPERVDMQIQRITEFPSNWWPATISEKTKWENFTETIYNLQCYSYSQGVIAFFPQPTQYFLHFQPAFPLVWLLD